MKQISAIWHSALMPIILEAIWEASFRPFGPRTGGIVGDFLGNNAGNLIQVMWNNYYYYYQY